MIMKAKEYNEKLAGMSLEELKAEEEKMKEAEALLASLGIKL